jgi:Secretion system C-terminal sorting domain
MKKLFLISAFISCSLISFGQCPTSPIELFTQADVDNFSVNYPGCTQITNGLYISGTGISNLNGLNQITSVVESNLYIGWNDITSFGGLENITTIDYLIVENTDIVNFSGFNSLENLGVLYVELNNSLDNFDGLQSIIEISSLRVENNQNMSSFYGLNSLQSVVDPLSNNVLFQIIDNPNIVDMSGLESLSIIDGQLYIFNNDNLQSLSGLDNLEWIDGTLSLVDNNNLNNISTISDIDNINGTFLNFRIENNPNLSECSIHYICQYINDPDANYFISNNAPGCNSQAEIEQGCLLSVAEVDLNKTVSIYPNPVSKILHIHSSEGIELEKVNVYSLSGEYLISTSEENVDLTTLSAGIYFVQVVTDQGNITKKIIKE